MHYITDLVNAVGISVVFGTIGLVRLSIAQRQLECSRATNELMQKLADGR